jgi:transcription termination/antitermination protein NusG
MDIIKLKMKNKIFALRTTANREDQVVDFITANIDKKGLEVYSVFRTHGLRGYIFLEARSREDAETSFRGVPYARELLKKDLDYSEVESMLEQTKTQMNIKNQDIVEIIDGPFKREKAKVTRIDFDKEEVVVELLEAAVSIPITIKLDSLKVIRRKEEDE